jgi:murein L,D-transpeptidase YafK
MTAKRTLALMLFLVAGFGVHSQSFREEQIAHFRVSKAYEEKLGIVMARLETRSIDLSSLEIFMRAFKKERKLEIWGRDSLQPHYVLLGEYRICRTSGKPGPKRKRGDMQIPEGFYHIDRFNPWSQFYLSLGINYPNRSDSLLSETRDLGGDIFIHGACVTIGCLPMTDDRIKEIYVLAVEAVNSGQEKIPVHIFPTRMQGDGYLALLNEYATDESLPAFWRMLEEGFLYFEMNKTLPVITIGKDGKYCFY